MKASVIVMDYLRKKYILDALKSIKNQKEIDLNDIESKCCKILSR